MKSTIDIPRKALIPVAGLDTRFLPFSKTIPKEILPIVDTPSILLLIEEAANCGFNEIVLIQGRGKHSIEDFFDISYELEDILSKKNLLNLLDRVTSIRNRVSIVSIRQKKALGLGHAILTGKTVIGNEPFAVMLGDELISNSNELLKLKKSFLETGLSTVSIMPVQNNEVSKYGIIAPRYCNISGRIYIDNLIEKPSPNRAPSNLALPGRYVFSPKIFDYLSHTQPGINGEIQLTDAMIELAQKDGLLGVMLESKRYDLGDKFGFLKANIEYGLRDAQISEQLKKYIGDLKL